MRLLISMILFFASFYCGAQTSPQRSPPAGYSYAKEAVGTTKGAEKINQQSNGAGQWKDSAQIYNLLCIQCHEQGLNIGPVILGRHYPAAGLKIMVRHGVFTMPPFFPSEISDEELEGLATWVQNSPPPQLKGGQ